MKERLRNIREERHARTEKNNAARKKVIENLEQQNLFLPSDYAAWINRYRSLSKKVDVITVNFPFLNLFFLLLIGVMGSVAFLAFLKPQSLFENFTTPLVILMVTPVAMVFVYYIVLSIMRCVSSIVKWKYQEKVDVMRCHAYCAM
ncbi:hypothetical protein [Eubacterium aggregans]|uniref:hypothetical protein n=1 Tax=Eubacterium aggregans TaxID=81409 RepID=UPI003F417237